MGSFFAAASVKLEQTLRLKKKCIGCYVFLYLKVHLQLYFFFHDQFEQEALFRAADIIWLGYSKAFLGSSGVLHQAIDANLLVLASNRGLINHIVQKENLGLTIDVDDPESIATGIKEILELVDSKSRRNKRYDPTTKSRALEHARNVISALTRNIPQENNDGRLARKRSLP